MAVLSCQLQQQLDAVAATGAFPPKADRKKRWAAKVKTGCATCRCVQMPLYWAGAMRTDHESSSLSWATDDSRI
ncbi:hypothetical protein E4U53_006228 [Claviceps sorghi]|nr:hypothetical protein E4U53_006228 [Claviceps sorghi]